MNACKKKEKSKDEKAKEGGKRKEKEKEEDSDAWFEVLKKNFLRASEKNEEGK